MWITATLSGQTLPTMIDTGATPNCIALRCVVSSSYLKGLTRKQYHGKTVIDANGNQLKPKFVISVSVVLGSSPLSFECDFIVIDGLPFSCILGQSLLSKFDTWSVCNVSKNIIFNNQTHIPFYSCPPDVDCIQLLTTNKSVIEPFQFTVVNTRVHGSALSALRPVTTIYVLSEGNNELSNRLQINILPSVFVASYQNCSTQLNIYNDSPQRKTIRKGVQVASCFQEFDELLIPNLTPNHNVNVIVESDPIEILCKKMNNLNPVELVQARQLLTEYKDVFSVSNDIIGRTDISTFNIDTNQYSPCVCNFTQSSDTSS